MSSSLSLSNVTTLLKRHNYCRHNAYIPGNFAKLFSQLDDAVSNICYVLPPALVIKFTRTLCTGNPWFKDESGKCSLNELQCAQCIKRSMFCLYLLPLKKVFGSICLCETTHFDIFIHCAHFSSKWQHIKLSLSR